MKVRLCTAKGAFWAERAPAGAGAAFAVTNNWSVRAEYRHSDFGDVVDKSSVAFFPATNLNRHVTEDQVQAGFSYKLSN
jgi:outer membrane immunogenic protein